MYILTRKVVLWYFFMSEKIHNSNSSQNLSVEQYLRWKINQRYDTNFFIEFGEKNIFLSTFWLESSLFLKDFENLYNKLELLIQWEKDWKCHRKNINQIQVQNQCMAKNKITNMKQKYLEYCKKKNCVPKKNYYDSNFA